MNIPSSPARNNYAAPNTPIASSKRCRTDREITSPGLNRQNLLRSPDLDRPEAEPLSHPIPLSEEFTEQDSPQSPPYGAGPVIHVHHPHHRIPIVSPSKNLFSPALRFEGDSTPTSSPGSMVEEDGDYDDSDHVARLGGVPAFSLDGSSSSPSTSPEKPGLGKPQSTPSPRQPSPRQPSPRQPSPRQPSPQQPSPQQQQQEQQQAAEEEDEDVFNPYFFIACLPPHESVLIRDKICLPSVNPNTPRGSRLSLVLDLDETLVHCTIEPIPNPDLIFPVNFNGVNYQVYVRKRPFVDRFLAHVSQYFEVILFTASQRVYADRLLDSLDPERKMISHRLFREACLFVQGNYLKDLTVLNRDLTKTLLVDNSPHAYGYQVDNGIPIESWFDDDKDTELLKLMGFLDRLCSEMDRASRAGLRQDVRPSVRNHFKTYHLVDRARNGLPVSLAAPPF